MALVAMSFASCKDDNTYADQKSRERGVINSFLKRDVKIVDETGLVICDVGKINVISEAEFLMKDSVTDLSRNEYVLFSKNGVYMQIVRKGAGEKIKPGESKRIICRFVEYNMMGDSIQLRNDVPAWHTAPDIMDVSNVEGTFSGTFNTVLNGGGAMYSAYQAVAVPGGWLVPLSYVNVGRQKSDDEQIAKVRIIVPHSQGQNNATSMVYPCFYELTYQEMRN